MERKAEITASQSVKAYCAANGVTGISKVRISKEGHPFVTMLSPNFEGGAINIWFSKNQATNVKAGQAAKELGLADLRILELQYEDGEQRLKIAGQGGDYDSVEDLF